MTPPTSIDITALATVTGGLIRSAGLAGGVGGIGALGALGGIGGLGALGGTSSLALSGLLPGLQKPHHDHDHLMMPMMIAMMMSQR